MWVGAASASIWLAQNLSGMESADKAASLSALNRLQSACAEVSNGPQSMAAYTSRLLLHLLQKVQDSEAAATSATTSSDGQASAPAQGGLGADSSLASSSAQGPSYVKASLSAPSWSVDSSAGASGGVGVFNGGGGGGVCGASTGATPRREVSQPIWATQVPDPSGSETPGFDFLGAMMPPMCVLLLTLIPSVSIAELVADSTSAHRQNLGEDLPFPAADDALWCVSSALPSALALTRSPYAVDPLCTQAISLPSILRLRVDLSRPASFLAVVFAFAMLPFLFLFERARYLEERAGARYVV